jgi:hypothetical protein
LIRRHKRVSNHANSGISGSPGVLICWHFGARQVLRRQIAIAIVIQDTKAETNHRLWYQSYISRSCRSLESPEELQKQKNTASGDAFFAMTFAGRSLFICNFSFLGRFG